MCKIFHLDSNTPLMKCLTIVATTVMSLRRPLPKSLRVLYLMVLAQQSCRMDNITVAKHTPCLAMLHSCNDNTHRRFLCLCLQVGQHLLMPCHSCHNVPTCIARTITINSNYCIMLVVVVIRVAALTMI